MLYQIDNMATIKIVLRDKEKPDGTKPLAIRITKDRRSTYIYTGQYISETDWDEASQRVKKSHANSARLNNLILKKLSEANDKLLELESESKMVSSIAVKNELKPTVGTTFFGQAEAYLEKLRISGEYAQMNPELSRINRFKEFLQGKDIAFSDITVNLLENYRSWLQGTRKLKERTIINHLLTVRDVFSQAIKTNSRLDKYYPFGRGKVSLKVPQSLKIGLTEEDVTRIENVKLPKGSSAHHARNLWLISFYFAGVRASDVLLLKWSAFHDNRLHYVMGKNNKPGSLKVPDKAMNILNEYREQKDSTDLVFPDLKRVVDLTDNYKVQRQINFILSNVNKRLKTVAKHSKVEKNISMHIARHTFGNISGDRIPLQMLQKLYRHSSITTTIGYQANFIHKQADDALEAVIGFN